MNPKITIKDLVGSLDNLPTLPEIALQVLKLSSDPNTSIEDFSNLIARDSSLTAKILRVANSSYYGFRNKITSLRTAIVMLGLDETIRLARAFTFLHAFPANKAGALFDFNHFWLHNMTVSEISQGLAARLKLVDTGLFATGGLLHDMGVIVMASFFEDTFVELINRVSNGESPIDDIERELYGMDHTEVGVALADRWNLPPELVTFIRHHHSPEEAPEEERLIASVGYLANKLADHYGVSRMLITEEPAGLETDPAWQVLLEHTPSVKVSQLIEAASDDVGKAKEFHESSMAAPAA